ncbi:TonB-dependent receptor [Novosphingobium sp. RL4]|uniref:TonB-dependent receptor n=1 Tax=Novosphingobium sp. RL4 TaxID=3109595 RepID=UPI002D777E71|nr:TonB-dependent receptor [Novosphingobium sp. RL4]WRT95816.1 TonB-dependent receptor [Novosphingobium sp. RL4]
MIDARSRRIHLAAALLAAGAPAPGKAETFRVPAGPLEDVMAALGQQAGATVILADRDLARVRSPGVDASLPLPAALRRALRGTGGEAVFIAPRTVRITKGRMPEAAKPPASTVAPEPAGNDDPEPPQDILVTASKQGMSLGTYPGSVKVVRIDGGWFSSQAADGSSAITRMTPLLGSTNLGNGRNKLFIRGIADSSFSGPTQATTGEYLGDVRLTYNGPDPDLNLYDMQKFEVLVGPQGTLYGPSALGGILRLVPNAPDMADLYGSASMGIGATRHGAASTDAAGMINVPLNDHAAVRWVVFAGRAGGYIDAPTQGRNNINDTASYGQRLTARFENVGAWTIEVGNVFQNFQSGDGQYVLRQDPPFTRSGSVPQPFRNNYRLLFVTARRPIGNAELTTVTSLARQDLSTVFDATGYVGAPAVTRLGEEQQVTLISHETRLAGGGSRSPWIAGLAMTRSANRRSLAIGGADSWDRSAGLQDDQFEGAIFAQASYPLLPSLTATAGSRLTIARSSRRGINVEPEAGEIGGSTGTTQRFSGTLGLVWEAGPALSIFADYRHGYRPGGFGFTLQNNGTDDAVLTKRYLPDDLRMFELGFRWGQYDGSPLRLEATLFSVDWHNIQADLVGPYAIPYTTNIGRGLVHGLDVELAVRPVSSITLSASAFLNRSRLREPAGGFATNGIDAQASLPNVPSRGGRISASWETTWGSRTGLRLEAAFRYVGPSRLGVGSYLDIPQGDYLAGDLAARLDHDRLGLSLTIANVTDSHGNTFSYGNPFGVGQRDQITPLRPRTIRIGMTRAF